MWDAPLTSDAWLRAHRPDIGPYLSRIRRGESMEEKRILIPYHAGIGDNLMLARYARELKEMGAYVHLVCQPELLRLFQQNRLGADSIAARFGKQRTRALRLLDSRLSLLPARFG